MNKHDPALMPSSSDEGEDHDELSFSEAEISEDRKELDLVISMLWELLPRSGSTAAQVSGAMSRNRHHKNKKVQRKATKMMRHMVGPENFT